jgi:predicted RNase H-like nuclease/Holliday junction resolvase RusA-like endonuclease
VTTTLPGFVGIDLAWGPRARTGIAVVDDAGRLLQSGAVRTDDEIDEWLQTFAGDVAIAAVDAPLIVPNETGQRRCETEISRAFWRYKIGAHSSSRGRAEFDPPRAATLAHRFGWSVDPARHGSVEAPVCIEVYPHPAMVGLFGLAERIIYKSGPSRAEGFAQLVRHFLSIEVLRLSEYPRWAELSRVVADPKPGDLTRIEDEMDAILCAHLAWLWHHRPDSLQVYGSLEDGYIVAPPPPLVTPEPPAHDPVQQVPPASTCLTAIAVDIAGRPTGFAAGDNEQRWKAAVRSAFAGKTVPPLSRVAIDVDYRLDPDQVGHNAPDLDNLLKATIDALDEVLGLRHGRFARPQADDERVDRIVASKRVARRGETPGARVVIVEL